MMNIGEFLKNLLSSLLDGPFEKIRIINAMNQSFKESFVSGEINRMCKVSISQGDPDFKHPMSSIWFRSGFKISIINDSNIKNSEYEEIAQYVLQNNTFIRQLMAIGFDTLIVQGSNTKNGKKFSLKGYANLDNYYLQ
jgi:hypothetical protein